MKTYDCVVIGAGPAGSTTAALVAKSGARTLLLEREKMPRFHVGESLMPECYWSFKRLGILDRMKQQGLHTRKNGVQFVNHMGKESRPFFFYEHDPHECSQTWHVIRSEFDQALYEKAVENGAENRDQSRVVDLRLSDDGSPHRLVFNDADGTRQEVESRVVVDATGQQSIIANRLGLRKVYPDLKKGAIWGYYKNGRRNGGDNPEVTCILHTTSKKSWFWYIPLCDGTVSVGCVGDNEFLLKRATSPEQTFADEISNCPRLQERLSGAELVSKLHVAKEFSYVTTQHAGPGWVLVGDAYGFIDPIYSSGVFLAFKSGEMAADAIIEGLAKNDLSAEQLGKWTDKFEEGVKWIRKLVRAFYVEKFSFGDFMKEFPHHRGNLTDLLVGRVFDGDPGKIFKDMDPWIERISKMDAADKVDMSAK